MDIAAYLERIRYEGALEPTPDLLSNLHHANLLAVPFENLDIHLDRPIRLDEKHLFRKIVTQRRGGFCYELNGLFAWMLRELGYRVNLLSAEVFEEGGFSPEFDHLVLLVKLEEDWLVDVGFGDSFVRPLKLFESGEQVQNGTAYRIEQSANYRVLSQQDESGTWQHSYRFNLEPRELSDYMGRCRYHQTSPRSHFTQKRLCTRLTEEGRITLRDRRLIETKNLERRESQIADEGAYLAALEKHFGIRLPALDC
jgi:N-hydroxyarylamine O-acetyltransferase